MKKSNLGAIIIILAGILWGFSGACGQYIFERFPIAPDHLSAIRMLSAGLILSIFGLMTDKRSMAGLLQSKNTFFNLFIYAVFGIMFSQLSYLTAISYTNSGTATILQYTGPVLVMVISCIMKKKPPTPKEVLAIILVIVGTFLIATHGNIDTMIINTEGLVWGLLSAVALALYTLIPGKLTQNYGSVAISGYGMLLGGFVLSIVSGVWNAEITYTLEFLFAFLGIVIFGTVLSYTLYLKGLTMVGPVTGSMLASVEPVAAAAFMIIWLGVPVHYMDFIGFTCILATIFLLTKKPASGK